mmetsp:Transcript_18124/g.37696  ORF Transcript_18124/g.37696 Transcript_18124/m.37696 type:complete len:172 (-) Transcript_18124:931-1446(-)
MGIVPGGGLEDDTESTPVRVARDSVTSVVAFTVIRGTTGEVPVAGSLVSVDATVVTVASTSTLFAATMVGITSIPLEKVSVVFDGTICTGAVLVDASGPLANEVVADDVSVTGRSSGSGCAKKFRMGGGFNATGTGVGGDPLFLSIDTHAMLSTVLAISMYEVSGNASPRW